MTVFPQPKRQAKPVGAHAKKTVAKKKSVSAKIQSTGDPAADRLLVEEALKARPANFAAWLGLAQVAYSGGDVIQSRRAALTALEQAKKPDQLLAVGALLSRVGEMRKALDATKAGYEQLGRPLEHAASALYSALATADWQFVDRLIVELRQAHAVGDIARLAEGPRTHLLWCADEATNIAAISGYMRRRFPVVNMAQTFALPPLQGRRLRIGYLSSDYRDHATAWLINGLFRHHDLTRVELFAYCCGWDDGSDIRKQVLSRFEHVHSVSDMSDKAAAQKIRDDQIDVLVDLNGPTRGNRLGILAQRAAPVQISYLGFPGTCGGRFVDYIVADAYVLPQSAENLYPEKIIRLSKTYQINDYAGRQRPPAMPRRQAGLPEGVLVLGVFNAVNKIRADVWAVWMEILKAVPQAVLWMLDPSDVGREHIAGATAAAGVDPKRIIAAPRMRQDLHLARLGCCDLMLDTWPYGGHTTTADALFAGVPVVTLEGTNFASRVSGGLLRAAGLEVLVQPDTAAYVRFAVQLLRKPAEIRKMKEFINSMALKNDVFNARSKARQLEDAYAVIADRAARQLPPMHVDFSAPTPAALAVAVVTPYWRTVTDKLARCCASVRGQTLAATHYLVGDGERQALPSTAGKEVVHVVLPANIGNSGATPRGIGAVLAFNAGFDAVAFLDDDNWFTPDHLSKAVELLEREQLDVVFARRHIIFPDGKVLRVADPSDEDRTHVDTNCYVLSRRAAFLAAVWAMYPREIGVEEDRVILRVLQQLGLKTGFLDTKTVFYETNWGLHYKLAAKMPVAPLRQPTHSLRQHFNPLIYRRQTGVELRLPRGSAVTSELPTPRQNRLGIVMTCAGTDAQSWHKALQGLVAPAQSVLPILVTGAAFQEPVTDPSVLVLVIPGLRVDQAAMASGLGTVLALQLGCSAVAYLAESKDNLAERLLALVSASHNAPAHVVLGSVDVLIPCEAAHLAAQRAMIPAAITPVEAQLLFERLAAAQQVPIVWTTRSAAPTALDGLGLPLAPSALDARFGAHVAKRMSAPALPLATSTATAPVWVIDPGLTPSPGHHRPLNQALFGISQQRREAWLFFGHQSASMDFPVVGCFRRGAYVQAQDWLDWLKQGSEVAALFAEDLQSNVSPRLGSVHPHCIFHSMTPVLLLGLARWLQAQPLASFPSAISLHFHVAPDFGTCAYGPAKGMVQEALAVILAAAHRAAIPVRATVHHPALLSTWRAMGLSDLRAASVPQLCPVATRSRVFNQRTRLLFIGPPLKRKGFALLIEALPQLLKQVPELDVRFVCAVTDAALVANLLAIQNPRVSVRVDAFIPKDVYEAELADADLVYCAYLPDAYAQMASNIFWESQALGVPALVMAGTASVMDSTAVGGRGMVLVEEPKPKAVVAACEKFIADRGHYREQAAAVKDVYRALLAGDAWLAHHLAPLPCAIAGTC